MVRHHVDSGQQRVTRELVVQMIDFVLYASQGLAFHLETGLGKPSYRLRTVAYNVHMHHPSVEIAVVVMVVCGDEFVACCHPGVVAW